MRLLILTQKVDQNDSVLGFFHTWLKLFALYAKEEGEKITVICLEKGSYDLPENVEVYSLGKERGRSKLRYIFNFYRLILGKWNHYDRVFVHMNPTYLVLGGLLWRVGGKKTLLSYTHRYVDWKLRIAEKVVNKIVTAAPESFRISSKKVKVIGMGIDVAQFYNPEERLVPVHDPVRIISVGRITKIKNLDTLVEATNLLNEKGIRMNLTLIGSPVQPEDVSYKAYLEELVKKHHLEEQVHFSGSVPNKEVAKHYWDADLSVNLAPTGGIDKAVLESMAAGLPVLVSNKAFGPYFTPLWERFNFKERDPQDLALKIKNLIESTDLKKISKALVGVAQLKAGFSKVVKSIREELN